ncbi:MAG: DUF3800 domain-containing protein [Planctomycetes bacterium]|nr:DUF3800 domain-containing protein [Planctomycetota bacterium]
MAVAFSDYIVYVDESGDHGMVGVDPHSPMFVLACCIFDKHVYAERACPALQRLKFDFFGHDMAVLHERDIRKTVGPFRILVDAEIRQRFFSALNALIIATEFTIIACAIDKPRLTRSEQRQSNPYHLALAGCLDRLTHLLAEREQGDCLTHVVFESRGKREDGELELEFRRICDGANRSIVPLPFDIVIANKHANATGLQLADLVARPIARHVMDPAQPNRAWDILAAKLYRKGEIDAGWGLIQEP